MENDVIKFGNTLFSELNGPKALVRQAVAFGVTGWKVMSELPNVVNFVPRQPPSATGSSASGPTSSGPASTRRCTARPTRGDRQSACEARSDTAGLASTRTWLSW